MERNTLSSLTNRIDKEYNNIFLAELQWKAVKIKYNGGYVCRILEDFWAKLSSTLIPDASDARSGIEQGQSNDDGLRLLHKS